MTADNRDEPSVGQRLMQTLATPLVKQMNLAKHVDSPLHMLDNACGMGALTRLVQSGLHPATLEQSRFTCADISEAAIQSIRSDIANNKIVNAMADVRDATDSGFEAGIFTCIVLGLALHLIPDPDAVLRDCRRILQKGGLFGATTFHADTSRMFWIQDVQSAFESMGTPFRNEFPMQTHGSGRWTDPRWIKGHLEEAGFVHVVVTTATGSFTIQSPEQFVELFGSMIQLVMQVCWSEETRQQNPLEDVQRSVAAHLTEKHGGQPWDLRWKTIVMTAKV